MYCVWTLSASAKMSSKGQGRVGKATRNLWGLSSLWWEWLFCAPLLNVWISLESFLPSPWPAFVGYERWNHCSKGGRQGNQSSSHSFLGFSSQKEGCRGFLPISVWGPSCTWELQQLVSLWLCFENSEAELVLGTHHVNYCLWLCNRNWTIPMEPVSWVMFLAWVNWRDGSVITPIYG